MFYLCSSLIVSFLVATMNDEGAASDSDFATRRVAGKVSEEDREQFGGKLAGDMDKAQYSDSCKVLGMERTMNASSVLDPTSK